MGHDSLGAMWGERAVHALCGLAVTATDEVNGIKRTMIGGTVFGGFGATHWERWRGTIILIPKMIDVSTHCAGWQIQDLMMHGINRDLTDDEMKDQNAIWKPVWREPK